MLCLFYIEKWNKNTFFELKSPGVVGNVGVRPSQGQYSEHIEMARKQNLAKIHQLRQTLEAAQQQELQYKSQMEVTC